MIITERSGIIIRSLQVQLIKMDIDAIVCSTDVMEIGEFIEAGYDNVLVDEDSFIKNETYIYLKDCVLDEKFNLFVLADTSNNINISRVLPDNLIKKIFYHPLDPKELANSLYVMCDEPIEKKYKILMFDTYESECRIVSGWLKEQYDVKIVSKTINAIHDIVAYKPDILIVDNEPDTIDMDTFWALIDSDYELRNIRTVLFVDYLTDEPTREISAILSKETKRESFLRSIDAIVQTI